jgi:hypothetical protein
MAVRCWPEMEPVYFRGFAMTETGLIVETKLPFACQSGIIDPAQQHANQLLMRVVNLMDVRDPEQDRTSERIEAKLDLMLNWLGWQLFSQANSQPSIPLKLGRETIEWETTPGEGPTGALILSLGIHPAVPSPLLLPAHVLEASANRIIAKLDFPDQDLEEAWGQWLFRMHRRAIQETRLKSGPA